LATILVPRQLNILENYYPVLVESYRPIRDSGGLDESWGGVVLKKLYVLSESGVISIQMIVNYSTLGVSTVVLMAVSSSNIFSERNKLKGRIRIKKIDKLASRQG